MAGITADGFELKTLEEILDEIESEQKTLIDPNINTSSSSVIGQLNGIYAAKIREVWELALAVYQASYPDTASGQSLGYLSALTGTQRKAATKSTVTATVNLNAGVTLPAGSAAHVSGNELMRYETVDAVTNSGGAPANFNVEMEATEAGSHIRANAGTLTVIATPVSGWNSVTNAADSVAGTDTETDAELRLRRQLELESAGSGTLEAVRADVLDVENVISVSVFENITDETDANNVPPHAMEVLVRGGVDADIAQAIFLTKPAGIQAYGTTTQAVTDSAGNSHTIGFTRPTEVDIYVDVTLDVTPADYVGDTAVKNAIVDYGNTLKLGEDVVISKLVAEVVNLAGVNDATILVGTTASTAASNIVIAPRQLAVFDTGRITVVT